MIDRPAKQAIQVFQVARFAALLGASILLSKSGLDTHDIGRYETLMLIAGTFSFFWINGTTHTFLSQYKRTNDPAASIATLFNAVLVLSVLLVLVFIVGKSALSQAYHMPLEHDLFICFLIYFAANNISFLTDYILLAQEKGKGLIQLSIFQFLLQIAAISIPAFMTHDLTWVLIGATAFVLIKALISLQLVFGLHKWHFNAVALKLFLRSAAPLILSFFLGGISIYVDGIIITNYFDKATFAVYQYGAREFPLSLLLANAFSAAMVSHISGAPTDVHEVKRGSLTLIKRLFPVVILLMAISYWIYPIVYNPQFGESFLFFNIYLLLLISRLVFPHAILLGSGHSSAIMRAAIAEFFINIAVSLWLLQWIGISGVAYGTVVAHISNKAILMYQLHKKGVSPQQYIPIRELSIYSILLIGVFVTFTYLIH